MAKPKIHAVETAFDYSTTCCGRISTGKGEPTPEDSAVLTYRSGRGPWIGTRDYAKVTCAACLRFDKVANHGG